MEKIIRPASIRMGGGRWASIFCKIGFNGKLSISGVIGPLSSGNALGGCGQIDMEFAHRNPNDNDKQYDNPITPDQMSFAKNWNVDLWFEFLDVWKKWHLNDLHSGCKHQQKLGWEEEGYDKHPSEPCPECGYKFGTAWHTVKVPKEVIGFLTNLPDADKNPAWV